MQAAEPARLGWPAVYQLRRSTTAEQLASATGRRTVSDRARHRFPLSNLRIQAPGNQLGTPAARAGLRSRKAGSPSLLMKEHRLWTGIDDDEGRLYDVRH
jgi:hypothetical protein